LEQPTYMVAIMTSINCEIQYHLTVVSFTLVFDRSEANTSVGVFNLNLPKRAILRPS